MAPPVAVQQIEELLAERDPRIEIISPRPGEMIGPGPWTLRLQLRDWPLVDAGELGIGPHLVVQLDDGPPQRLTTLECTMAPLRPGSHRLTVYAARPWGEAVRSPGAFQQIFIHRAAVNPLALPSPGSPQLILVSPGGPWAQEPVLLDWLLLDAPLRDLRSEGSDWRLRISVNGDSFLVDRQTPLWLKGWPKGRSGLLLELVDDRGEPLNPPFNSLVTEVERNGALPPPPWLRGRLDPDEINRLLGRTPPAVLAAPPEESPPAAPREAPEDPADLPESLPPPLEGSPPVNGAADIPEQPGNDPLPAGPEPEQPLSSHPDEETPDPGQEAIPGEAAEAREEGEAVETDMDLDAEDPLPDDPVLLPGLKSGASGMSLDPAAP